MGTRLTPFFMMSSTDTNVHHAGLANPILLAVKGGFDLIFEQRGHRIWDLEAPRLRLFNPTPRTAASLGNY